MIDDFNVFYSKDDEKKFLSVAGTQLDFSFNPFKSNIDWGDIGADIKLGLFNRIPETQTKRLIDFFKKHLRDEKDITIVGHSLGGNLTQMCTAMFGEGVEKAYTFNSPGAKELKHSVKKDDPYFKDFDNFTNNRNSDKINRKITNVKGSEGISLIAGNGVDIGDYRIDVATSSHSILKIIEAIEKVDKLTKRRLGNEKKYF